jgi:hypothetical protein
MKSSQVDMAVSFKNLQKVTGCRNLRRDRNVVGMFESPGTSTGVRPALDMTSSPQRYKFQSSQPPPLRDPCRVLARGREASKTPALDHLPNFQSKHFPS